MADDGRLVFHVAARALLVAARFRSHLESRGYRLVPTGTAGGSEAHERVAIVPEGPNAAWIYPEHAEALHDDFGRWLSHGLRCRVTGIVASGPVLAYEVTEAGARVEHLAVNSAEIVDDGESPYRAEVAAGRPLADLLVAAGFAHFARTPSEAERVPGALVLDFVPKEAKRTKGAASEVEIDPLLACPKCGAPLRVAQGSFGAFYACVRYPECRGKLTARQADVERKKRERGF